MKLYHHPALGRSQVHVRSGLQALVAISIHPHGCLMPITHLHINSVVTLQA